MCWAFKHKPLPFNFTWCQQDEEGVEKYQVISVGIWKWVCSLLLLPILCLCCNYHNYDFSESSSDILAKNVVYSTPARSLKLGPKQILKHEQFQNKHLNLQSNGNWNSNIQYFFPVTTFKSQQSGSQKMNKKYAGAWRILYIFKLHPIWYFSFSICPNFGNMVVIVPFIQETLTNSQSLLEVSCLQ